MPRLLKGIARSAAVAGAAKAVTKRISDRQTGRWSGGAEPQADDEERPRDEESGDEPAPADDMSATLGQLRELGELRTQGVLNDAEFEQQKARILGN